MSAALPYHSRVIRRFDARRRRWNTLTMVSATVVVCLTTTLVLFPKSILEIYRGDAVFVIGWVGVVSLTAITFGMAHLWAMTLLDALYQRVSHERMLWAVQHPQWDVRENKPDLEP